MVVVPVLFFSGLVLAYVTGGLADDLGISDYFREMRITGHRPGYPSVGDILRGLFFVGGIVTSTAYGIKDNVFLKTAAELSAIIGIPLLVGLWMISSRSTPEVPPPDVPAAAQGQGVAALAPPAVAVPHAQPAVPESPMVYPTVEMPDGSDVEHIGVLNNVVVVEPGRTKKHPVRVINRGETWWFNRALCRLGRDGDSDAVESSQCVDVPQLGPGESVIVTLEVEAPLKHGQYRARWKMVTSEGEIAFPGLDPLTLHVIVR